jgi:hypothetical protein
MPEHSEPTDGTPPPRSVAESLAESLAESPVDLNRLDRLHPRPALDAAIGDLIRAGVAEVRQTRDGRALLCLKGARL